MVDVIPMFINVSERQGMGGSIEKMLAYLLSDPAAPGSIPRGTNFFQREKLLILLRITALLRGKWTVA